MMCIIDINGSAVHAPAADRLALHQMTDDPQCSAVHSWGAQLQVTNCACLGDDVIIQKPSHVTHFFATSC